MALNRQGTETGDMSHIQGIVGYKQMENQNKDDGVRYRPIKIPENGEVDFSSLSERTPLISSRVFNLSRSVSIAPGAMVVRRNLGWIGGVCASVALGQLSTNLFQRVGECHKYILIGNWSLNRPNNDQ